MRTLLRPRLLVLHVLVLLIVAMLLSLGRWQVDRFGEARVRTEAFTSRVAMEPEPVSDLLAGLTLDDTPALADLELRRATATGVWRPDDEVLQRGRSLNGQSGFHVLTPLDLADGSTVVVRRGWIPFDNDLVPPAPDALPPTGEVLVEGFLERSIPQPTGRVAQRDPDQGELDVVFNADLSRIGAQMGAEVRPMLLHLESMTPAQAGPLPVPADRPVLDNGPHLNYAIQWFSFATIAVGMYALWLRRRVRGDERAISRFPTS